MGSKYTTQTATGYNASPPADDGTHVATNKVQWGVDVKAKIGDPLKTLADAINTALVTFTNFGSRSVASNDTTTAADHMMTLECSGTFTETLLEAATASAGYLVSIKNIGTGVITIVLKSATDTLDGTVNGTMTIQPNGALWVKTNVSANGYYTFAGSTSTVQTWTAAQRGLPVALTSSGASIAVNLNLANNFTHLTTENTTLAAPTNPTAGQSGVIVITQGATPRTLVYNTFWKFPNGVVQNLTSSVGAVDSLSYYVESATRATCNILSNVS